MTNKITNLKALKNYARLDHFLKESLPQYSRASIEKLIVGDSISLNDRTVNRKNQSIYINDTVCVQPPETPVYEFLPSRSFDKIFEDQHLLIINKPEGISVHPGSGKERETILDIYRYYYPQVENIAGTDRPGIVHRIDKDTSGLLLLAKDLECMKKLQKSFKNREVKKTYIAIVQGKMRFLNGKIDQAIIRSQKNRRKFIVTDQLDLPNVRDALTEYSVWLQLEKICLLKVYPVTGRTHQIRVHLSHLGNPILGDRLYGRRSTSERLALHAYSLKFYHPISGNLISAVAPLPESLKSLIKKNK